MYAAYITSKAKPNDKIRVLVNSRQEAKEIASKVPYASRYMTVIECRQPPENAAPVLYTKKRKRKLPPGQTFLYTVSLLFDNNEKSGERVMCEGVPATSFEEAAIKTYVELSKSMDGASTLADVVVLRNKRCQRFAVWVDHAERFSRRFSPEKLAAIMKARNLTMWRISLLIGIYPAEVKEWLLGSKKPGRFKLATMCDALKIPMLSMEADVNGH